MIFINNFFKDKTTTLQTSVIKWWEKRRITYNLLNIICLIIGLLLIKIITPNAFHAMIAIFAFIFGFFLNLFYTIGWIVSLIIKRNKIVVNICKINSLLLIFISVFSMFTTFLSCLIYILLNIP